MKLLRKTLGDKNIGYHELGGYELFTHDDNFLFQQCESAIENFNIEFKDITNVESTYTLTDEKISKFGFDGVSHLIWNKCQGQIDTGLMMESLLEKVRNLGVTIFNGIEIEKWEEAENSVMVHCNDGFYFEAKKMIFCNNGFAKTILPQLDVRAARAQVLITNEIANLPFEGCFHYDKGYYYFRNIGKRVLFGGGRNLNFAEEATTEFGLTELIQNRLEEILKNTILRRTRGRVRGDAFVCPRVGQRSNPFDEQRGCSFQQSSRSCATGRKPGARRVRESCDFAT